MARLKLSKSSLSREQASLKTYQQFLPSLDMKRQELMTERAKAARQALKFLTDCPQKRHQVKDDASFDMDDCVRKAMDNKQELRATADRRDFLAERIKAVEPWGDFNLLPAEQLAGLKLWFYIVPLPLMKQLPRTHWVWQEVRRDSRYAHVVVVSEDEPPEHCMPVPRTHTGALSLTQLNQQLNQTELALEDLRAEREFLTRWIYLMTTQLARSEDKTGLHEAAGQTLDSANVFTVQGWLAESELPRLKAFCANNGLALLVEDPAPEDAPPTLLGGFGFWLAGNDSSAPDWLNNWIWAIIASGLIMVFLFGSQRPLQKPVDWFWRLLDGLKQWVDITRLFGDVLSYLRLFALGLASASLALTFNNLAHDVRENVEGPGLLFSLLILLAGHGLNLLLSLMSAVVHGLRLNFIEFYNWGLSEEGYPFKAFSKREMDK